MTVNPGFGGQTFIPRALDKVQRLRRIVQEEGYHTRIEVAGGIKVDRTAQDSVRAGATILVSGMGNGQTIPQAMDRMRACIRKVMAS